MLRRRARGQHGHPHPTPRLPRFLSTPPPPLLSGAPWPNEGLTEFFTAVRSLLNQPRFAAEAAAEAARQQAAAPPAEPAGVFTLREEVHQAP